MTWQSIDSAEPFVDLIIWLAGVEGDGRRFVGQIMSAQAPMWLKDQSGANYFPDEEGEYATHWWSFDGEPMPPPPEQEQ